MAAILKESGIDTDTVTLLKKGGISNAARNNGNEKHLSLQSLLHFTGMEKVYIWIMKNWLFSLGALQATKKERLLAFFLSNMEMLQLSQLEIYCNKGLYSLAMHLKIVGPKV